VFADQLWLVSSGCIGTTGAHCQAVAISKNVVAHTLAAMVLVDLSVAFLFLSQCTVYEDYSTIVANLQPLGGQHMAIGAKTC